MNHPFFTNLIIKPKHTIPTLHSPIPQCYHITSVGGSLSNTRNTCDTLRGEAAASPPLQPPGDTDTYKRNTCHRGRGSMMVLQMMGWWRG
ncbi:hypothetical protein CDAR_21921 [Caerostris darwini]|uniref:Uncharacterized protein n=1 Tax=Caerostris darwini TaxID=1538125 RepID=A0AAV4VXR1_9ARAC|nr:hypothetical protein CDAR_21921 [Caerostris darwini]